MSTEANRALLRAVGEQVLTGRDLTRVDAFFAPDVVHHNLPPHIPPGREALRGAFAGFLAAFPDLQTTAEDAIAEGDKAVVRWSGRGTHLGDFNGIPPTGRAVHFAGIVIARISNGHIVEEWEQLDMLGVLQQLGVAPMPAAAPPASPSVP